ncbi:MAG TPA: hypothetical protein DCW31_06055 [Lactobacillus sp.]|nr:hypothetical protein [Lactobacillus sp.]
MRLFGHGKKDSELTTPETGTHDHDEPKRESAVIPETVATDSRQLNHQTQATQESQPAKNTGHTVSTPYEGLVSTRTDLERQVNQLNHAYGDARNHLRSQMLTEKDYLRSQSRIINQDYERQTDQRDADFEQFSQLQDQRNHTAAQLKQLIAAVNQHKQQFEEQQTVLTRMQEQAKAIAKQRESLKAQEQELLGQINNQANLTDLMGVIAAKQKKIAELNQQDHDFAQAETGLQTALTKQQALVDRLGKQVTVQEKAAQGNNQVKARQQRLMTIDAKLKEQQVKLSADDKELSAIKHHKDELGTQFETLAERMKFYFSSTKLIDTFQFDSNRHYVLFSNTILPINQLTDQRGLEIIDQLFEKTTSKFDVLTTDFNRELVNIWEAYQTQGLLRHSGAIMNPYLAFQRESNHVNQQTDVALPLDQAEGWQVHAGTKHQPELIEPASGKQTVSLEYRADRSLESVKYFQNDQLFKMAIYDQKNTLLATQYVDSHDAQRAASEIYYRADHSVALEKMFFNDHVVIQTTASGQTVERTFETENAYYEWWIKTQALKTAQDSLIIDTTVPFFTKLLNDNERQFEIIPLVTDVSDPEILMQIIADDSPVNNMIVNDESVHQEVLRRLKRDMHIMVINPQHDAIQKPKTATIKTQIYIPKVS